MDIKRELMGQAFKLIQDPRVAKALQNPKVMQGVVGAMQLGAKVQKNLETGSAAVVRGLNLATNAEIEELRSEIDRLRSQLADEAQQPGDPRDPRDPRDESPA